MKILSRFLCVLGGLTMAASAVSVAYNVGYHAYERQVRRGDVSPWLESLYGWPR